MKTWVITVTDEGLSIEKGLRLEEDERLGPVVVLGERNRKDSRWELRLKLTRALRRVVFRKVVDAIVEQWYPLGHEARDPLYSLDVDRARRPGALVRINARSPFGPPGKWERERGRIVPKAVGRGAYDDAGTQTYYDDLVECDNGAEFTIRSGPGTYRVRIENDRPLDVSGGVR